jgi:acyl-CoA thioesterase FadM
MTRSGGMHVETHNGAGGLAASGTQRGIFLDLESGRPKRLADDERALFAPYVVSEEPASPRPSPV